MAKGELPELLNYKQKGKDMNEFIKVPMSEKLAYCFGDPALTFDVYNDNNAADLLLHKRGRYLSRCSGYDHAALQGI